MTSRQGYEPINFCEVEMLRRETLPWKLDIAYRYIRPIGWKAEIGQLVRVKLNIDCLKICLAHRMENGDRSVSPS